MVNLGCAGSEPGGTGAHSLFMRQRLEEVTWVTLQGDGGIRSPIWAPSNGHDQRGDICHIWVHGIQSSNPLDCILRHLHLHGNKSRPISSGDAPMSNERLKSSQDELAREPAGKFMLVYVKFDFFNETAE